jgi:hypothetical protein
VIVSHEDLIRYHFVMRKLAFERLGPVMLQALLAGRGR